MHDLLLPMASAAAADAAAGLGGATAAWQMVGRAAAAASAARFGAVEPETTPPRRRPSRSRSRTPPRQTGAARAALRGVCGKGRGPGRRVEDTFLGRLPTYRLLDVEACLAEFCPQSTSQPSLVGADFAAATGAAELTERVDEAAATATCLAVLGSGPGSEVEAVCRHFKEGPVSVAVAIDAFDWSAQAKAPVTFRQLDLRGNREEIIALLSDEALFPLDARVLVVASSVASDLLLAGVGGSGGSSLLEAYLSELPPHADLLLLEPLSALAASGGAGAGTEGASAAEAPGSLLEGWGRAAAAAGGWPGFMYLGGPRLRSLFFSRRELLPGGTGGSL